MIKRIILSLSVVLLGATFGASAQKYLNLGFANGAEASFALADSPTLSIQDGKLVVTAIDGSATYTLGDLRTYEYSDVAAAGTDAPAVTAPVMTLDPDGGLAIRFATPGHSCRVYDAAGAIVLQTEAADVFAIPAGTLPAGNYIVVADNSLTVKVALK